MKSKKLFAILTLVAFMMTLVPALAFGVNGDRNATGSSFDIDVDTVDANGEDTAKVSLVVYDNSYAPLANEPVYFASSRGASDTFVQVAGYPLFEENGTTPAVQEMEEITFTQVKKVATAEDKAAWDVANPVDPAKGYLAVGDAYYGDATADGQKVVTAKADVAGAIAVVVDDAFEVGTLTAIADGSTAVGGLRVTGSDPVTKVEKGNGVFTLNDKVVCVVSDADGKVEVKVKSKISGKAVIGAALDNNSGTSKTIYEYLIGNTVATKDNIEFIGSDEVEFTAESGENVSIDKVQYRDRENSQNVVAVYDPVAKVYKGDVAGKWGKANGLDYFEVFVKVTNKAGAPAYDQKIEFSSDKSDCYFSKTAEYTNRSGVASTKVYADKAGTYEISYKAGSSKTQSIKIYFAPATVSKIILKSDDNRLLAKDTAPSWKFELQDAKGNKIDVTDANKNDLVTSIDAVDYPTDGNLKSSEWTYAVDADNNWLKITPKKNFRKEGTYKTRVTLNNGEYAEFSFQIKEQGPITGLTLKYDQTVLCLNAPSGAATVKWVDAAGVEKTADSGINYSASDYNKINGSIASNGSFAATKEKDYTGDLIITAFDSSNKLSASFTIKIARELAGIQVVEPADSIAVGETGLVTVKFVDLDGNQVAYGSVKEVGLENGYALSKPADAKVSIGEGTAFGKGLKEKGLATLEVRSDKGGEVTYFVNVKAVTAGIPDVTKYYTASFKVNFGEPKKVADGAANKVVMFIGSKGYTQDGAAKLTDVAPFIKDGRTFVAVRPLADAFGVKPENIGWNEATQTVTLTRDDITVTIVIGSSDIEVVQDGVVSTVTADVPAFISEGRTVLPFRAVGDAFGVTTSWDAATQSVTYEL